MVLPDPMEGLGAVAEGREGCLAALAEVLEVHQDQDHDHRLLRRLRRRLHHPYVLLTDHIQLLQAQALYHYELLTLVQKFLKVHYPLSRSKML